MRNKQARMCITDVHKYLLLYILIEYIENIEEVSDANGFQLLNSPVQFYET